MSKSAFISIIGVPNAGKSSLLNRLLGTKVAIISPKPQTTRTKITGVLTEGDVQTVFIDTPGFHRPKNQLGQHMMRAVGDSLGGIDGAVLVVDAAAKQIKEEERELIERLQTQHIKAVLALNKIDTLPSKDLLLEKIAAFSALYDFEAVVPLSALKGENIELLKEELEKFAVEGPFFFPEDTLTDQPERVLVSEIIREKILKLLSQEVPHGVAVSIEKMRMRDESDLMDIEAVIYCERESHKGIIIGKKGAMLKKISTQARADIERFFACRVNLSTWVKVKEDWRNRQGLIHNFGLDFQNE
ncbi:MAG: GTPase Era [Ruminococcaceae bacterium]|nr:GTPase Era [Oscillospiraceae bacterium]